MDHVDVIYLGICSSDNTGPYKARDFLKDLQSLLGTDLLPPNVTEHVPLTGVAEHGANAP